MRLTVDNFFSHLIFHPFDAHTKKDKVIALVASIACGIFSIGICHVICAIRNCFTHKPHSQTKSQDEKLLDLRDSIITNNSNKSNVENTKNITEFESIDVSKILDTTLQSLKNGLSNHKIDEFISIKVDLQINNEPFQYNIEDTQNTVRKTDDLLFLESPAKQMIQKISQNIVENDETSIKWNFILTNSIGIHTFSFFFKKTPNYHCANGALFGSPGYSFLNTNSGLSNKELEF